MDTLQESTALRIAGATELVRRGAISVDQLPFLKSAMIKVDSNLFLPYFERTVYYNFVRAIMDIVFNDATIKRLVQNKVLMQRHETTETDLPLLAEDIDLRKVPDGMLMTYANAVHRKKKAGGKPTEADRKMVSRAKTEIRRRKLLAMRGAMRESNTFEERVQLALQDFNVSSVADLSSDQMVEFTKKLNGE